MDALFRPIVADELELFVQADGYGFGERAQHGEWASAELDRTVAAFVADEIVATGRNYSLELTVPGGAAIPAAGVSWITTRPTHRRRGLLTQIMTFLAAESSAGGEVVSILTASEGGLYQRFGYGVAARIATFTASRAGVTFLEEPVPDAVLRLVEPDVALELVPPLFDRVRRLQAGAVSRPEFWWPGEWAPDDWIDPRRRFDVVVEFDGVVQGCAMYAVDGEWKDGFTEKLVAVRDLIAATPAAEAALWQYLFNVDLTVGVRAWNRPLDDALPWLITDPRQIRTAQVRDSLWVRPLDTAAFLAARTYGAEGSLTIAVTDRFLDDPLTAGVFTLTGGGDGAECVRSSSFGRSRSRARRRGTRCHFARRVSPESTGTGGATCCGRPGCVGPGRRNVSHRPRTVRVHLVLTTSPGDLSSPILWTSQLQPEVAPFTMPKGPAGQRKQSVIN